MSNGMPQIGPQNAHYLVNHPWLDLNIKNSFVQNNGFNLLLILVVNSDFHIILRLAADRHERTRHPRHCSFDKNDPAVL